MSMLYVHMWTMSCAEYLYQVEANNSAGSVQSLWFSGRTSQGGMQLLSIHVQSYYFTFESECILSIALNRLKLNIESSSSCSAMGRPWPDND